MTEPIIAEFAAPEALVLAARRVHDLGYAALEAYTPFPIPELEDALRIRRTRIPALTFMAGATGASVAYLVLSWTNAVDYRLNVGGRPYDSIPTDIPIMFETMVLFAALTAFLAALLLSGLPRLHHRVFEMEGFEKRTTHDRFWLAIGGVPTPSDTISREEIASLRRELIEFGAVALRRVER